MPTYVETGLFVLYALVVWWGATGIILWLNSRAETTYRASLVGAALLAAAGFVAVALTSDWESTAGSLIGFTGALSVWAFVEMLFLMGIVVGWNAGPPPEGERGWARFRRASLAIAHHEVLLLVALIALALLVYGAPNPTAFWSFGLLWVMRISTKLNIFLGVPNTAAELLPARLAHLRAHFRTARPSVLFPISVAGAAVISLAIYAAATSPEATPHSAASGTLLLTFALLGLLEHLLLVAPFRTGALWGLGAAKEVQSRTTTPGSYRTIGSATRQPSRQPDAA
jgi:putative photosynthetic complex assembly protein 2